MARRTMPVNMLADSTKKKYSQAQINERQQNEETIKKAFNNSNKLEKRVIKDLDKLEKIFFNEIKHILETTGTYTAIDSVTVTSLANIMAILVQARQEIKVQPLILNGKQNPLLKTIQQYTVLQNQLFKELSLSISERDKLAQMSIDGDFETADLNNLDALLDGFFKEGA